MKKMFGSMMAGFAKWPKGHLRGMPKEDMKKMMDCGEHMMAMCPCVSEKDTSGSGGEKKAMQERMISCCSGKMEMMSSFFKKMGSRPDEAEKSEKA